MPRGHIQYNPYVEDIKRVDPRSKYSNSALLDLIIRIQEIWIETYGETDLSDIMMRCTVDEIEKRLTRNGEELTDENIYKAMQIQVSRDDWAYEMAYGKERQHTDTWPARRKTRRKRTRQSKGQISMAI